MFSLNAQINQVLFKNGKQWKNCSCYSCLTTCQKKYEKEKKNRVGQTLTGEEN